MGFIVLPVLNQAGELSLSLTGAATDRVTVEPVTAANVKLNALMQGEQASCQIILSGIQSLAY